MVSNYDNKRKQEILLDIIAVVSLIAAIIFTVFKLSGHMTLALIFKSFSSLLFLSVGILAYRFSKANFRYGKLIIAGLVFGMIGDVFLAAPIEGDTRILLGAGAFTVGHVFYLIGISTETGVNKYQVVSSSIIMTSTMAYIVLYPAMMNGVRDIFPVAVLYAGVISAMTGSGIALIKRSSKKTRWQWFAYIAAVLFYVSDFVLIHVMFVPSPATPYLDMFNTLTYFPAQSCFALSILYLGREKALETK